MYKLRYLSYGYGKFDHLTTWVEKKTFVGRERGCKEDLKYKKTWTLYDEMMPNNWCFKERKAGDFPGGPVVKTVLTMQEVQVWSLVKELRSHMLHSAAKIEKKKKERKNKKSKISLP